MPQLQDIFSPKQLREDADALVDLILKEAHWNYPVPKFMNREECTQLLLNISKV